MTLPTTPTGGEPTAGPEMCLVTLEKNMGEALVEAYLAAPTLAARVVELEGMLAVAREALVEIGNYEDEFSRAPPDDVMREIAAQAIAQLDKEAGGK